MADKTWFRGLLGKPSTGNGDQRLPTSSFSAPDEAASTTNTMASWGSKPGLVASESHLHLAPKNSPGRPKTPYRGSSLWPLNLRSSPSSPPEASTTPTLETVPEFRRRHSGPSPEAPESKRIDPIAELWHNPTLVQMGEALQSAMMSAEDPLTPIPIEYNSYVFRLLEAYRHHYFELQRHKRRETEIASLRARDLEDFREQVEGWIQTEKEYKAQIKCLELRLAKESKDGVGAVILARHESVVSRSKVKTIMARAKRIAKMEEEDKRPITSATELEGRDDGNLQADTRDSIEDAGVETNPPDEAASVAIGHPPQSFEPNPRFLADYPLGTPSTFRPKAAEPGTPLEFLPPSPQLDPLAMRFFPPSPDLPRATGPGGRPLAVDIPRLNLQAPTGDRGPDLHQQGDGNTRGCPPSQPKQNRFSFCAGDDNRIGVLGRPKQSQEPKPVIPTPRNPEPDHRKSANLILHYNSPPALTADAEPSSSGGISRSSSVSTVVFVGTPKDGLPNGVSRRDLSQPQPGASGSRRDEYSQNHLDPRGIF